MKSTKLFGLLAALGLMAAMAGRADAGTILYDYTTTLSLVEGTTDTFGLNGAFVDIKADVSSSAVYTTVVGSVAVIMNNDATVTISGSSNAANNGTFALPQLVFLPTDGGLYLYPTGAYMKITLPVGGLLTLATFANPTATAETEIAGNTVNILDFGPTTGITGVEEFSGANALYDQVNPIATASLGSSGSTPEPATLGLIGGGLLGFAILRRRRASS